MKRLLQFHRGGYPIVGGYFLRDWRYFLGSLAERRGLPSGSLGRGNFEKTQARLSEGPLGVRGIP